MDFREGYKNSAETLSPDKQTVERMKAAVLQQIDAPKKAFPFKRIAYIGGTVVACLVIAVVGISALHSRDASSITETASDTSSICADAAEEEAAEMPDIPTIDTTTAPSFTTTTVATTYNGAHIESENICEDVEADQEEPVMVQIPSDYEPLPEEAPAAEYEDEVEEPVMEFEPEPDAPGGTENSSEDNRIDEPVEEPDDIEVPDIPTDSDIADPTDTPAELPITEFCEQILFSDDMNTCTIFDTTYHYTEDAVESEEFESVPVVTDSGKLGEAILISDNMYIVVYLDGEYIGCYRKE